MIKLPNLPYAYDALEPTVSSETMHVHHDKHHAKYVDTVNKLAGELGLDGKGLEEILAAAEAQKNTKLINNAGQAWNHAIFWNAMTPDRRAPGPDLAAAITQGFKSLEDLKAEFVKQGAEHFGSGWVWLVAEGDKLSVATTHDGATFANRPQTPLLVCDLWEHAYYLDYKQDREGFLKAWFDKVANWAFADSQFEAARGQHAPWTFKLAA